MLSIRALMIMLLALLLSGCATTGGLEDRLKPTYVLVLTIDGKHLSTFADLHCTANCSVGDFDPQKQPIFHVEDLGYGAERTFSQIMISPRWHQPDLRTAREWGRCVVEGLEKPIPNFDKVVVTSAYLVRVLAPAEYVDKGPRTLKATNPCQFLRTRK